ncbi:MAG: R3H domain-containing nucleic acid-binding protein [Bacilli bacterium]
MIEVFKIEGKDEKVLLNEVDCNEIHYIVNEIPGKLFKSKKYELKYIKQDDIKEFIKEFILNLGKSLKIDIKSEMIYKNECYNVVLDSEDNSLIIGKDGRTLNSIQLLIHQIISNLTNFNIRINVDVANYKEKKQKRLESEIKNIAKEVSESKIEAKLDPMNSYERRLVHTIISEYKNLETESFGENPERYVVIRFKED